MNFTKVVTLTYSDFKCSKYFVKSLQADGGYAVCLRQHKARVFKTQGMVDKAIEQVRASICARPECSRPEIRAEDV